VRDPGKVAVVGVTGYAGFELAKLLLRHPAAQAPVFYLRDPQGAQGLEEIFPQLRGCGDAPCRKLAVEAIVGSDAGTAFLSTPAEVSAEIAPALVAAGLRVVDLSGAFRFRGGNTFSQWYKLPAPPASLLAEAVYGLPEIYGQGLAQARLVANPGCYPTAVILALKPLTAEGWIAAGRGVVCDCKSGASGAGKEPKRELHFVEVDENARAYNLFTHRHTPEITEHAGVPAEEIIFSTHLLPLARGLLATIHLWLERPRQAEAVEALYRRFYAGRPMVRIWPRAAGLPELQHVAQTNFCDIGFALDAGGRRLIVVSCLDNLGKGAAGQAVQNFNGMLGIAEHTGLR